MRCVPFLVAVAVLVVENVNSQYVYGYQRRYYNQRPILIYPSGSGVVQTYVPSPTGNVDLHRREGDNAVAQKVRLDVYFEADCPDSMRFITRQLYPLYQEMDDALDIHLVPYGKARESYDASSQRYNFRCQHGPSECYGNAVQSCTMSLYPKKKDYMSFINCMMSYPRPSQSGHKCARRMSVDWEKIEKCAKGDEGNRIMHEMAQLTENLTPRLYYVPWIVVNKVQNDTTMFRALRDLKSVVCESYKGSHPKCSK